MNEAEAHAALEHLVSQVRNLVADWNERSPTLLASALSDCSLSLLLEVLENLENLEEPQLFEALAKMLLARYAHEEGDLQAYRSEIWQQVREHQELWGLRKLLAAILEITRQQPRNHPSYETYHAIGLMSEEALQELERTLSPFPQRRRRRYHVNVARTAELPELSSLTFEPVETALVETTGGRTGTLSVLPSSIALPTRYHTPDWLVNWHELEMDQSQCNELLNDLPRLYGLLESWDVQQGPYEMLEHLHTHEIESLLYLSGVILPHREQVEYLRYLSILIHLKLLSLELPLLNEQLRRLFSEAAAHVQPLLSAVAYYLYCSSYSFYGIQEQALKRLESHGYLYHLILEEWSKNKRIRSFARSWLSRREQSAVKLLAPSDWEFIFYVLNRGWAESVVRDVYGIFHGSSAFANQIVQPDTSKGFGNLRESSGVSFLATSQISDLLRKQPRAAQDAQTRQQHFDHYVSERFRKDVLRKEQRPSLNAPTLKRLERFATSVYQRAEQHGIEIQTASLRGSEEVLQAYAYLRAERLNWLGYEMTRLWLAPWQEEDKLEAALTGVLIAMLRTAESALTHRQEAGEAMNALLSSLLNATLDHALQRHLPAVWIRNLPNFLPRLLKEHTRRELVPLYEHYLMAHKS